MSQELISHSRDLKKLRDEGYEIEVRSGYALVHSVPYVNASRQIKFGTLVSELTLAGDRTTKPNTHVIYFRGEHPCNKDGTKMIGIQHQSKDEMLLDGVQVNHSFSNKPPNGYDDYYGKFTQYICLMAAPAYSLDNSVNAQTFRIIESNEDHVFKYLDTCSSRNNMAGINAKLAFQKIGIVGLGGTGSYVLDLVAKTPVKEIHLFDGDLFLQHNAFRAPGATSKTELERKRFKVDYFRDIYSAMRKNIVTHPVEITETTVGEVLSMDFIFVCIDDGESKALLLRKIIAAEITCIDVGMGIQAVDDSLIGIVRTTTLTPSKNDHVERRISLDSAEGGNDYTTNIQTADLNCLNAALAVIKWKKLQGFYHESGHEHHTTYTINTGVIDNDEYQV